MRLIKVTVTVLSEVVLWLQLIGETVTVPS